MWKHEASTESSFPAEGVQTRMERSLHRQLKERYGPTLGGRNEVVIGDFRVDAVDVDGRLIEIQAGPLGLLKTKLVQLLPAWQVHVIKPVIVARRLIRRETRDGADQKPRRSPKRGKLLDVFDELVALARIFPHTNLGIDILAVDVDEIRLKRRRPRGDEVLDRSLIEVVDTVRLRTGADLWALLPADPPAQFSTIDLARWLSRPLAFAQRVAYCLHHTGAARVEGKDGRRRVFERCQGEVSCGSDLIPVSPGR